MVVRRPQSSVGARRARMARVHLRAPAPVSRRAMRTLHLGAWPNPSLKWSANGRPPAPGRRYAVHCSPARAWRPTVVARLARTLGSTTKAVWRPSRKCACRREPNSHDVAKSRSRLPAPCRQNCIRRYDENQRRPRPLALHRRRAAATDGKNRQRFAGSLACSRTGAVSQFFGPPPPEPQWLRSASAVAAD